MLYGDFCRREKERKSMKKKGLVIIKIGSKREAKAGFDETRFLDDGR